MSFKIVSINETCQVINGGNWNQTEYVPNGVKVIKVSNLINDGIDESNIDFLPLKALTKYNNNVLNAYDLVVTTVGSHPQLKASAAGRGFLIPKKYEGSLLNQNAVCIRTKDENILHNRYLAYLGRSFIFRHFIQQGGRGAANQMRIAISVIKKFKFNLPPIQTQKRIANILSAYDDLIENNLNRIKLLEQAAQNIYKEWFVNLRFPGHENTPINKETGLPEGWEIGVISDFGKVVTGKTPSKKRSDFYGGHIPFIKTPDMHGFPYVIETSNNLTELGQQAQLNKNLPANSVLVSCIGTAGVVAMTSKLSQTNQQINSVVFESTFKSYYFYCFAKTLRPLLEGLGSNGATMVNVNKGKFENVDLNIPIEGLLVEYAKIAEPMFNQMLILSIQNQKLKVARDILLPRLMNRTIEV